MRKLGAPLAAFVLLGLVLAAPAAATETRTAGECTVGNSLGVSAHIKRTHVNIRISPSVQSRAVGVAKPGSFFCQTAKYTAPDGEYWRAGVRIATIDGGFVGGYVYGPLTTRP